jgi:hypothetical protein
MKKILLSLILLALTACSIAQTPEEKYYVLTSAVTATGRVAEEWVDRCKAKPVGDSCREKLPKIHAAAKGLQDALRQSDEVFVTKEANYYDLAISVTTNALKTLEALLKEEN